MRTSLLAGLIAVLVPACLSNEISGIGDDVQDMGSGSGSGSGSNNPDPVAPRIDISVDKPTISTELRTTHQVVVTLTSVNGFEGAASLSATAVDGADLALAGWTATLDNASVTLTAGGSAMVNATLTIPMLNSGLVGNLKIAAASSAAPSTATSAITVANQVTFSMSATATACTYPTTYGKINSADQIANGTTVRWYNTGNSNFEIHMAAGESFGFSHQGRAPTGLDDPITEPATAYEQTAVASSGGTKIQWYCHAPSDANTANYGYFVVL